MSVTLVVTDENHDTYRARVRMARPPVLVDDDEPRPRRYAGRHRPVKRRDLPELARLSVRRWVPRTSGFRIRPVGTGWPQDPPSGVVLDLAGRHAGRH